MKEHFVQNCKHHLSVFTILAAALLCILTCACAAKNSDHPDSDYLFVGDRQTTSTEGMYYFAPETAGGPNLLNYIDFDTCSHTVVCPKPNCPHTDPAECYAMDYGNGSETVIPIDGMIYWTKIEDDGSTNLYRAKADGTDRAREAELPKRTFGAQLLYFAWKLYFIGEDSPFTEFGGIADATSSYLLSYDFEAKEAGICLDVREIFPDADKIHATLEGYFDGKIYMIFNGTYFYYDPENGKSGITDLSPPTEFCGEYMIKPGKLIARDGKETEFEAPDNGLYGYRIVGDKLFTRAYVYDLPTGKRFKNLISEIFYGPKLYRDWKFLVYDWNSWTFEWMNEGKVMGDEVG